MWLGVLFECLKMHGTTNPKLKNKWYVFLQAFRTTTCAKLTKYSITAQKCFSQKLQRKTKHTFYVKYNFGILSIFEAVK
jgi:hypothetical protein